MGVKISKFEVIHFSGARVIGKTTKVTLQKSEMNMDTHMMAPMVFLKWSIIQRKGLKFLKKKAEISH
jgi:hypothetical protein